MKEWYLAGSRVGLSQEGKKDPGIIAGCKLNYQAHLTLPAQPAEKCGFSSALSQLHFQQALKTKLALISGGLFPVYGMQNRALSW